MKICNEKEQAEQIKILSVQFEEKGAPGSGMDLNLVFKEID